jgi:hypothetical protein
LVVLAKDHKHDAFVGDHGFNATVADGLQSATVWASGCLSGVLCVIVRRNRVLGGRERRGRQ